MQDCEFWGIFGDSFGYIPHVEVAVSRHGGRGVWVGEVERVMVAWPRTSRPRNHLQQSSPGPGSLLYCLTFNARDALVSSPPITAWWCSRWPWPASTTSQASQSQLGGSEVTWMQLVHFLLSLGWRMPQRWTFEDPCVNYQGSGIPGRFSTGNFAKFIDARLVLSCFWGHFYPKDLRMRTAQ